MQSIIYYFFVPGYMQSSFATLTNNRQKLALILRQIVNFDLSSIVLDRDEVSDRFVSRC